MSVAGLHTGFGASLLDRNFFAALELLADQVLRPSFPEDQLDAAKQVLRQDLYSLEDDPPRLLMQELRRNFLPDPWGRSSEGTLETIDRLAIEDVRQRHQDFYQPSGSILSVAGNVDWPAVRDRVGELFGNWPTRRFTIPKEKIVARDYVHIPFESAQTHIGVAYPCEPLRSPEYMLAWSAVGVLSGGMSSRLFDEIREKRGLCYSVYATYSSLRDRAGVYCYCGTGADRAGESLAVLLEELDRLRYGIDEDELRRLKVRARTTLVMQQESTGARSAMMTRDWYHLGRIRKLDEIDRAIDSLNLDAINDYLDAHPPGPFHVVTLGPEPLSYSGTVK